MNTLMDGLEQSVSADTKSSLNPENLKEKLNRFGFVDESDPLYIQSLQPKATWATTLEVLKRNPGEKAQKLYEKLRKKYNLT